MLICTALKFGTAIVFRSNGFWKSRTERTAFSGEPLRAGQEPFGGTVAHYPDSSQIPLPLLSKGNVLN